MDYAETLGIVQSLMGQRGAALVRMGNAPVAISFGRFVAAKDEAALGGSRELAKLGLDAMAIGMKPVDDPDAGSLGVIVIYERLFQSAELTAGLLVIDMTVYVVELRSDALAA